MLAPTARLATVENIRQLCRCHNQYEARLQLGQAFMERVTRRSRKTKPAEQQPSFELGP